MTRCLKLDCRCGDSAIFHPCFSESPIATSSGIWKCKRAVVVASFQHSSPNLKRTLYGVNTSPAILAVFCLFVSPACFPARLHRQCRHTMEKFLREWRQDALNKAQYDSAIFIGDKLLALTRLSTPLHLACLSPRLKSKSNRAFLALQTTTKTPSG